MAPDRLSAAVALAAVMLAAALGLGGCGRIGPLGLPPGATVAQPVAAAPLPSPGATGPEAAAAAAQETAARTGFDAQGNPVAAPGQKKSFILDPLLQ